MFKGREKVGAVIRVFALSPDMVGETVRSVMELLTKLLSTPNDKSFIDEVVVLIPVGKMYHDNVDCGDTRLALLAAFQDKPWARHVSVTQSTRHDLWWRLPNYGMHKLNTKRCVWGLMVSADAAPLWNESVIDSFTAGMYAEASIVGMRRPGSLDLVSNTLAMYRLEKLSTVGGFVPLNHWLIEDHAAAILTAHGEAGPRYGLVGSEEMVTSVLMAKDGSRIALFENDLSAVIPADPLRKARWDSMLQSKEERAMLALQAARLDPTVLRQQTFLL